MAYVLLGVAVSMMMFMLFVFSSEGPIFSRLGKKEEPEQIESTPPCNHTDSFHIMTNARIPQQYAYVDFNRDIKKRLSKHLRRNKYVINDYNVINKRVLNSDDVFSEERVDYLMDYYACFNRYEVTNEEWHDLLDMYYSAVAEVIDRYVEERQNMAIQNKGGKIEKILEKSQQRRLIEPAKNAQQWQWQLEALESSVSNSNKQKRWYSQINLKPQHQHTGSR